MAVVMKTNLKNKNKKNILSKSNVKVKCNSGSRNEKWNCKLKINFQQKQKNHWTELFRKAKVSVQAAVVVKSVIWFLKNKKNTRSYNNGKGKCPSGSRNEKCNLKNKNKQIKNHFVKVKKENVKVVVVMKSVITNLEKWKIIELFRKAKISVPSGSRNKKCN